MAQNQESIEDKIEGNERRIASLTEELRKSLSSKEKRIVGLEDKIEALEKEIQKLKDENKKLNDQLKKMRDEKKIQDGKIKKLEKDNEDQKARICAQESVLIILQIGTKTQRNMCKFVLGEHFKEYYFYKFKDIEKYMDEDLEHPEDKEAARQRLKELKENISWDQRLVDSLKNLNHMRIGIAHPELSSEKIQQATEFLKEKGELDEEVVENINKLKEQWETTEALLQRSSAAGQNQGGPRILSITRQHAHAVTLSVTLFGSLQSSAEEQNQGDPRNLSTTGRKHGAYPRKASGGLKNPLPPKRARKGQTGSAEERDQGNMPTTRKKNGAYPRKASGEPKNPLPPKRARKGQTSSAEEPDQGNVTTTRQKNGTYASKATRERAITRAPPPKCDWGSRSMPFI